MQVIISWVPRTADRDGWAIKVITEINVSVTKESPSRVAIEVLGREGRLHIVILDNKTARELATHVAVFACEKGGAHE